MQYRLVQPEDNQQLIELSLRCPMESEILVSIDRSPDYFAFYNLFGPNLAEVDIRESERLRLSGWVASVAVDEEDNNKIKAVFMTAARTVLFEGKEIVIAQPADARADPDIRRKGIIRKTGLLLHGMFGQRSFDAVLGYIIRGNAKARKGFMQGEKDVVKGIPAGDFHLVQISMYRPYRIKPAPQWRPAEFKDKKAIIDFLREHYEQYNFAPALNEERWDEMLRFTPGYDYQDIRLVERDGKIIALLGLWDSSLVRKPILYEFSPKIKAALMLAKAIHFVLPSPPPPKEKEPQITMYIKHIACLKGSEDLLFDMIKQAANDVRRTRKYHYLWCAHFETDPYLKLYDSLTITKTLSGLYYSPYNTGWFAPPEQVRQRPCFADFSMV